MFKTRETVVTDTPARAATSCSFGRATSPPPGPVVHGHPTDMAARIIDASPCTARLFQADPGGPAHEPFTRL
ncbi:hypothetical protein GCM10010462_18350 [Microbacterium dextranolyticum]